VARPQEHYFAAVTAAGIISAKAMSQNHLPSQAALSKVENSNLFTASYQGSATTAPQGRRYSFDADSDVSPFTQTRFMDYDQTEGLGGLSVSSYDSIEDERTSIDTRAYPYHGKFSIIANKTFGIAIFSPSGLLFFSCYICGQDQLVLGSCQ
jgi:hypothetical protein